MLILGDTSGIQDFLFDIRETGGKQAAMLRFHRDHCFNERRLEQAFRLTTVSIAAKIPL